MKNLFKTATLLTGILMASLATQAQQTTTTSSTSTSNGTILSIGADGGFSAGSFKKTNKWDFGGSIQADIPVASQFFFTANAGYLNFFGKKNIDGSGIDATAIHLLPVKAGLKYFLISDLYVQAEAGAAFALNKSNLDYQRTAAFLYTPQIGVLLPLGGKSFIDAGAYYEATTKFSSEVDNTKVNFFGLRIAYAFGTN